MNSKRIYILFIILILLLAARLNTGVTAAEGATVPATEEDLNRISSLQLPFIKNEGQIDNKNVSYYANTFGGAVFVTPKGELVYSLLKFEAEATSCQGWVIKESFAGASAFAIAGEQKTGAKVSYFQGYDPANWKSNISTYNLVSLGEIYQGIELKLKAYGNNVEKLFYLQPGANPASIKVKIAGAKDLQVNETGELEVETGLGTVKFTQPVAYQDENGERNYIEATYAVNGDEYGFEVRNYDKSRDLVIDPLLASTFLGGVMGDQAYAITQDNNGHIYVAGITPSPDFPTTPGAYNETLNYGASEAYRDVFISKLDSNLENLLASTFLGGSAEDRAKTIALDGNGNVYVTGLTESADFPTTPGAYDTTHNWGGPDNFWDVFVSKLDSDLENLLASTFIGGETDDKAFAMTLDGSGNVYIAGVTNGTTNNLTNYPTTPGAYDTDHHGSNAFVSKLDSNFENLLASTYIEGSEYEEVRAISLDSSGHVYVTGSTTSPDYPITPDAFDTVKDGRWDAFISKLDNNLTNLLASTYLGSSGSDNPSAISIDSSGNIYVAGASVGAADFPTTPGAYDTNAHSDAFVTKLDGKLENLLASTGLGGLGTTGADADDSIHTLFLDASGNIYVAGYTEAPNFPTTPNAYDTTYNGGQHDAFAATLDGNLENLLASTYLGGGDHYHTEDNISSIFVAGDGTIYVAGWTDSPDFPTTPGAYDVIYDVSHQREAFVSKFDSDLSAPIPVSGLVATNDSPTPLGQSTTLTATVTAGSNVVYNWTFDDGATGSGAAVTHTYPAPGSYTAVVSASNSANLLSATTIVTIIEAPNLAISKSGPATATVVDVINYTLTVTNSGPSAATGVLLTDILPPGVTFGSASASQGNGCNELDGTVTCDLGSLANGATATVAIDVTPTTSGMIINTATAAGNENDPDMTNNTATFTTTVLNLAPTVEAGADATINEGDTFTGSGSFSDPDSDTWTATVDYDDSSGVQPLMLTGHTFDLSYVYDDNDIYTATITVTDDHNALGSDNVIVTVLNVAPAATFTNTSGLIIEGEPATLTFSNPFDPSSADTAAGFLYSYDCTDDGRFELGDDTAASFVCVYPNNGIFTARGRIKDKDGGFTDYTVEATVLTPQEATESVIDEAEDLVDAGVLNQGQGNSLIGKLENAIKKLDRGQTTAAVNMLGAFTNQVNDFINTGVLSPEEGQSLLEAASRVIDSVS